MADYQTLLVDKKDGVTTITLNRPEKRNAMSPQLHREMYDCLNDLRYDKDTRVIIITGAGESFCAGQDLKQYFIEMDSQPERVRDEVAVGAVLLAVHREDQLAHVLADVLRVDRRRERLAVAQHLLDVVPARDVVLRAVRERGRAAAVALEHRALGPGPLPHGVRLGGHEVEPLVLGADLGLCLGHACPPVDVRRRAT